MADFNQNEPNAPKPVGFLGRGWSFPTVFAATGGPLHLDMVAADEDIRQSLHILFHTEPGERIMNANYGCALRQFLFEPMDTSAVTRLKAVVEKAVLNFESRIRLLGVEVNVDNQLDGVLLLEVSYVVRSLNSRHNVVFPFQREATLLADHSA
jgi:phage baseplate assembly protein W